jgi:hypothetical protein
MLQDFWCEYYQNAKHRKMYNMCNAFELNGKIDTSAFVQTIETLELRHESLRTVFVKENDGFRKKIVEYSAKDLRIFDFVQLSEIDFKKEAEIILSEAANYEFRLFDERPLRCALIKGRDDKNILILSIFHMVIDGSALSILIEEFSGIYNSFLRGDSVSSEVVKYKALSHYENRGVGIQKSISVENMARISNATKFYPDKMEWVGSENVQRSSNFERLTICDEIGADRKLQIEKICSDCGLTLHSLLLAVTSICLGRATNSKNLLITDLVSTRDKLEMENAVGLFLGYLFVHNQLDLNDGFKSFSTKVQEAFFEVYQNQNSSDLLFFKTKNVNGRYPNGAFQFVLNFVDSDFKPLVLDGLNSKEIDSGFKVDGDDYDLFFRFFRSGAKYDIFLDFRDDILSFDMAKGFLKSFFAIIDVAAVNTDKTIRDILGEIDSVSINRKHAA